MANGAYQVTGRLAPTGAPFATSPVGAAATAGITVSCLSGAWTEGIEATKPASRMFDVPANHRTRRPWEPSQ